MQSIGDEAPIYECRNATYALSGTGRIILKDIDLEVRRGEFLTIVGGSGTGKTSLLRILAGLIANTAGSVRYCGEPVRSPPDGIAVVFQDYTRALLQWRTVSGNVALGLEARIGRVDRHERIASALSMVGLSSRAGDYPWQLSGGMQQRVQIARALALRPSVMLMDEPFGALDAMTKESLQDELLAVHGRTNMSVVFITHDIDEAVYLGDRVVVLAGAPGRIYDEITIDLGRPRRHVATRQSEPFLALRSRIYSAIEKSKAAP
jgi:NitT/TauT family transport system ATP-binding protein